MRTIIIGAGNLATHLGKALMAAGHEVPQVYSRTMQSAQTLASVLGAEPVTDIRLVRDDADLYVFSVKDSALEGLVAELFGSWHTGVSGDKVFLHTAGSMPMDVFGGKAAHYGVLYPMQTFSRQREVDFGEIPCFVEGNDEYALERIESVARQISRKVYRLPGEDRKYLHLAAVFACNFVNHCYALGERVLGEHGIPFEVMLPLVDETARKVHEMRPVEAQTGPAVRYDANVLGRQAALLDGDPATRQLYEAMSQSIHRLSESNKN